MGLFFWPHRRAPGERVGRHGRSVRRPYEGVRKGMANKKKQSADEIVDNLAEEMGVKDEKLDESKDDLAADLGGLFGVSSKKKKKKEEPKAEETPAKEEPSEEEEEEEAVAED